MKRVTGNDFEARLESIVKPLDPRFRARAKRAIGLVQRTGVNSQTDLYALLRERRAATNHLCTVCWILGRLGDKRAVDALMDAFKDGDTRLRQAAAQALGELRSSRALPSLIKVLQTDEDANVRMAAASALGSVRNSRAFGALASMLAKQNEDPRVRGMATEALASLPHHGTEAVLIAALSDPSAEVRFWAAFGLGQLRSARALPKLESLAASDDAILSGWGPVRQEAIKAIEYIRCQ